MSNKMDEDGTGDFRRQRSEMRIWTCLWEHQVVGTEIRRSSELKIRNKWCYF